MHYLIFCLELAIPASHAFSYHVCFEKKVQMYYASVLNLRVQCLQASYVKNTQGFILI